MKILLLSPYHSGSHKAWASGLIQHSQHDIDLFTLPGTGWKWRMHGGAVTLARQLLDREQMAVYDLVLSTDMLDFATFRGLTAGRLAHTPHVLYMHENQLLYPLSQDKGKGPMRRNWGLRERQYVLINWKSMCAADHILFNSQYHLDSFYAELPIFLSHYHDFQEIELTQTLIQKSSVLPCGIDLSRFDKEDDLHQTDGPPIILWNQRWEFDKNPDLFFEVLHLIASEGIPFRLAICGEHFQSQFDHFKSRLVDLGLEEKLIHFGYADHHQYIDLLHQADITISTSLHEFFGISILEAIYCKTFPILPKRLSYPELIPTDWHNAVLYTNKTDLINKLRNSLKMGPNRHQSLIDSLSLHLKRYDWPTMIGQYDQRFTRIALNPH